MITMLLTAVFSDANAESISEIVCTFEEFQIKNALLNRQNDIPIGRSKEFLRDFHDNDNLELRMFLSDVVGRIYKNPSAGKIYLDTKQFFNDCVKIHRGY